MQIDRPEYMPHVSKGVLKCSTHNPNSRAAKNYSIFYNLGQTLSVISALEVLHMCPTHRNSLISFLGTLDISVPSVIKFDITDVQPHLP